MSMYKELDSLIADCGKVLLEDPPGLRQKVVARYMTMFENTILETTGTGIRRTGAPRIRGDDPCGAEIGEYSVPCSPHTRG